MADSLTMTNGSTIEFMGDRGEPFEGTGFVWVALTEEDGNGDYSGSVPSSVRDQSE